MGLSGKYFDVNAPKRHTQDRNDSSDKQKLKAQKILESLGIDKFDVKHTYEKSSNKVK